jgi:hypothetical protein
MDVLTAELLNITLNQLSTMDSTQSDAIQFVKQTVKIATVEAASGHQASPQITTSLSVGFSTTELIGIPHSREAHLERNNFIDQKKNLSYRKAFNKTSVVALACKNDTKT